MRASPSTWSTKNPGTEHGNRCLHRSTCPAPRSAVLAGVALGVAWLTKSTLLVLGVVWPVLWLVDRFLLRRRARSTPALYELVPILFVTLFVVHLGYRFEGSFTRLGDIEFASRLAVDSEGNQRWATHWIGNLPSPLPENYMRGIDRQKVERNPDTRPIHVAYFPSWQAGPLLERLPVEPLSGNRVAPGPGWYAVSLNELYGKRDDLRFLRELQPQSTARGIRFSFSAFPPRRSDRQSDGEPPARCLMHASPRKMLDQRSSMWQNLSRRLCGVYSENTAFLISSSRSGREVASRASPKGDDCDHR